MLAVQQTERHFLTKSWLWNQSKSKIKIPLKGNKAIVLAKFNPRKHPKTSITSQPAYKLWVCKIESADKPNDKELNFLWTEKGKKTKFSSPPLVKKTIAPQNSLKLSDYAFLKEFIHPEIAQIGRASCRERV